MCKNYNVPVFWLRVTDFMHGWLESELGGNARIGEQRVVSLDSLPGAKEALKMETTEDVNQPRTVGLAMSAAKYNCVMTGLDIDGQAASDLYGLERDDLKMFVPVECPKLRMTEEGVMRPWTTSVCAGRDQTNALLKVIRQAFWQAVEDYDRKYAGRRGGKQYAAIEMIEAFCAETRTPDTYAEAMRREWQRRNKRDKNKAPAANTMNTSEKSVPITQLI